MSAETRMIRFLLVFIKYLCGMEESEKTRSSIELALRFDHVHFFGMREVNGIRIRPSGNLCRRHLVCTSGQEQVGAKGV